FDLPCDSGTDLGLPILSSQRRRTALPDRGLGSTAGSMDAEAPQNRGVLRIHCDGRLSGQMLLIDRGSLTSSDGCVATLWSSRRSGLMTGNLAKLGCCEQTNNKAMEQTNPRRRDASVFLAFADHLRWRRPEGRIGNPELFNKFSRRP